jgi:predicted O-linked N-acetylglucosamine transferase (SPINDLY family)
MMKPDQFNHCFQKLIGLYSCFTHFSGSIRAHNHPPCFRRDSHPHRYNLGVAHSEQAQSDEAIIAYNVAIRLNPRCAEAWNNLGVLFKERGNYDKAIQHYQAALTANPLFSQTLNNLCVVFTIIGDLDAANAYCQRAIETNPTFSEAYNNLGVLHRDEGRIAEAIASYGRCLELDPASKNAAQNRLLALNYSHEADAASVGAAHREWGEAAMRSLLAAAATTGAALAHSMGTNQNQEPEVDQDCYFSAPLSAARPLRVGFVSPDFFTHSVSYFIEAPLRFLRDHRVALADRRVLVGAADADDEEDDDDQLEVGDGVDNFDDERSAGSFGGVSTGASAGASAAVSAACSAASCANTSAGASADDASVGFHLVCYSNVAREDAKTAQLRALPHAWRSILGMSARAAADMIRADRIDVLVELTGAHF